MSGIRRYDKLNKDQVHFGKNYRKSLNNNI